jgi:hypothetical protein
VGTLQCLASAELVGTGTGAPYHIYNVAFSDPPGVIPPQRYVVKASSLATVTDEYYEAVSTKDGSFINFGGYPDTAGVAFQFAPITLPGDLIQYYTAGAALDWAPAFYEIAGSLPTGGQTDEAWQSFQQGAHLVMDWNRYPLHTKAAYSAGGTGGALYLTQPSALRTGDKLTVTPYLFGDNVPGHISGPFIMGTKTTLTYTIDQNGIKVASGSEGDNGIPPVTLSGKPSVVQFTFDATAAGPDYKLSTADQTVWTWLSAPNPSATVPHDWYCSYKQVHGTWVAERRCSVQSMMTLDYQVNGMLMNGTVPAGAQTIDLTVGHIQLAAAAAITGVSAAASCNGGKTWQKASVASLGSGQYKVGFSEPEACDVTLRTSATDAAGGSITETITDAYAVTS